MLKSLDLSLDADPRRGARPGLEAAKVAAIRTACTQPKKLKQDVYGRCEEDPDGLLTLDLRAGYGGPLRDKPLSAAGGAVLGAALAAMPSPLPYEAMDLHGNGLTDAEIAPIAAAIGGGRAPHLKSLDVSQNELGDEGRAALQAALPRGWHPDGDDDVWSIDEQEWSTNDFWDDSAAEHGA